MKKKVVSLLAILIILVSSIFNISFANEKGKVILINLNRTNLEDMLSMSTLKDKVNKEGYIGLMNIRGDRGTDDKRSYASIGAGGRITLPDNKYINFEEATKANKEAYKAETGKTPKKINDMSINYSLVESQEKGSYGSVLGSLGQTLADNNLKASVIGNSDIVVNGELVKNRNIALMAMDHFGRVDDGNIDNINIKDNTMPYAIRSDYNKLKSETKKFYDNSDVIFVELGDTYRLDRYKSYLNENTYENMKNEIYSNINSYLEEVFSMVNKNDTIYIMSTFPKTEDYKNQKRLSPVIKFDNSGKGILKSPTTRRDGVIGNVDIGADILAKFGLKNDDMVGKPISSIEKANNVDYINHDFEKIVSIAHIRTGVVGTFIGIVAVACVIGISLLLLRDRIKVDNKIFYIIKEFIKLGFIIPLAFLISPVFNLASTKGIITSVVLTTVALYIVGRVLFKNDIANLAFFATLMIIVIVIDSIIGTPLMQNNIMSYDTLIGARYYGIGNEYEGITIGCAIFALATLVNYKKIPKWLVTILALGILITTAYPGMGANVGGAISESIAYFILVLLVFDNKIDFKKSILVVLVAALVVLIFTILDIVSGSQSHLSVFVGQIMINGPSAIIQTFARKIQMNIDIAQGELMSMLILVLVGIVTYFIIKPKMLLKTISDKYPYIYKGFVATMIGCIVTLLVNDSGVVAASTSFIYIFIPIYIMIINILVFKE
ncbi:MAG: hypothetical protein J6D47_12855 [Peptostreptococcaceae bacterium]|nr:hypothetical protein [Peptostreptococcaceae bacterium]